MRRATASVMSPRCGSEEQCLRFATGRNVKFAQCSEEGGTLFFFVLFKELTGVKDGKNAHFKTIGEAEGQKMQTSYPCVCVYLYIQICVCIYTHIYIHTYSIYTYKQHSYIHVFFFFT